MMVLTNRADQAAPLWQAAVADFHSAFPRCDLGLDTDMKINLPRP